MNIKMNALLAKVDHAATVFKKQVSDYVKFFASKQGAFLGEIQTYEPKEGVVDDPSKRGRRDVITTVGEKLDYFKKQASDYFDNLMSVEKSNSSGIVAADLIVDGKSWGKFTSLELLRLKGFLEAQAFVGMLHELPVRSDSVNWRPSTHQDYKDRQVFENERVDSTVKTTVKENYILEDPNLAKLKNSESYNPVVAVRTSVQELGEHTRQQFSGEISQVQKAKALEQRSNLYSAVIIALKEANENAPIPSELSYDKVHTYLFGHI